MSNTKCGICGHGKQYVGHSVFHPVNRGREDVHLFRAQWMGRNRRTLWVLGTVLVILVATLVVI